MLPALLASFVLLFVALAWCTHAAAQSVEVGIRLTTDDETVYAGDSVVVDVQAVGLIEPLDTSPLFANADLLRETAGTRIAVIGGQVVDVRTRRLELLPRGEGDLTLGPLTGETVQGTVQSNALDVKVLPPIANDWAPGADDVSAETRVSKTNPYVREEIVVDIVLRHRYPIADERIVLPDFDGFDVLPVFERRRPQVGEEDSLRRIEWRYLLWPRRSGALEIGAVRWTGTMVRSRTARGPIDVARKAVALNVRPAPPGSDGWWLPAREVRLTDAWSEELKELKAGQEIERTLTLEADGVLASQLPSVEPLASRSFTSVALGNTREQTLVGDRVRASASYRFRLTARRPVPVFLDTVRVGWWDTERNGSAEAIVPARRVDIGLPDRADLLAGVALERGGWSRLMLVLGGVPVPTGVGLVSAGLLGMGLLATALGWRRRVRLGVKASSAVAGNGLPPE